MSSNLHQPSSAIAHRSAVSLPPTNFPLWDALPAELLKGGKLSQLQLEGILYACTKHQTKLPTGERAGFFIGGCPRWGHVPERGVTVCGGGAVETGRRSQVCAEAALIPTPAFVAQAPALGVPNLARS